MSKGVLERLVSCDDSLVDRLIATITAVGRSVHMPMAAMLHVSAKAHPPRENKKDAP